MNIDKQAREAATSDRLQQEQRQAAMDARTKSETQLPSNVDHQVSEAAREAGATHRHDEEHRASNMQRRAQDG